MTRLKMLNIGQTFNYNNHDYKFTKQTPKDGKLMYYCESLTDKNKIKYLTGEEVVIPYL